MSQWPDITFIVRFEMAKVILLVGLFAFVAVQLSYAAPNPDDTTQAAAKTPGDVTPPVPVKKPAADATPPPSPPEVPAAPARNEGFEKEHRKAALYYKPILRTIDVPSIPDLSDLSNIADPPKSLLDLPEGLPNLSDVPDLPDLSDVPDQPDDLNNETRQYMPSTRRFEIDNTDESEVIEPSTEIADSGSPPNSSDTPAPEAPSVEAKPDAAEAARAAVKTEAPAEAKA